MRVTGFAPTRASPLDKVLRPTRSQVWCVYYFHHTRIDMPKKLSGSGAGLILHAALARPCLVLAAGPAMLGIIFHLLGFDWIVQIASLLNVPRLFHSVEFVADAG